MVIVWPEINHKQNQILIYQQSIKGCSSISKKINKQTNFILWESERILLTINIPNTFNIFIKMSSLYFERKCSLSTANVSTYPQKTSSDVGPTLSGWNTLSSEETKLSLSSQNLSLLNFSSFPLVGFLLDLKDQCFPSWKPFIT